MNCGRGSERRRFGFSRIFFKFFLFLLPVNLCGIRPGRAALQEKGPCMLSTMKRF